MHFLRLSSTVNYTKTPTKSPTAFANRVSENRPLKLPEREAGKLSSIPTIFKGFHSLLKSRFLPFWPEGIRLKNWGRSSTGQSVFSTGEMLCFPKTNHWTLKMDLLEEVIPSTNHPCFFF